MRDRDQRPRGAVRSLVAAITGSVVPVPIDYAVDDRFPAVGVPVEIEAPEGIATPAAPPMTEP